MVVFKYISLAFSIFPGNQNGQQSLKPLEKTILQRSGHSKFIYCCDAGLGSEGNREFNHMGERSFIVTQSINFNGMPECNLNLAQAVVYLSLAPRSNALYRAYETAKIDARNQLAEPVPLNIRNAPTSLMEELHYGEGYTYAHDTEEKIARMTCLPERLEGRRYYLPTEEGTEKVWKERLERSRAFRLVET